MCKKEDVMDVTEKKLNQILNLINLIHSENTFVLSVITNLVQSDTDRKTLQKYIDECNDTKKIIMSGIYEDDINIVD